MSDEKNVAAQEDLFKKYIQFQGFLEKKNPKLSAFMEVYQKRFFCIRDHGTKLVYYKKEPKENDTPKGIIEIKDIQAIVKKSSHNFNLKYMERNFELRTLKSDFDCIHWIRVLEFLQNYYFEKKKEMGEFPSIQQKKGKESWKKHSDADLHAINEENKAKLGLSGKKGEQKLYPAKSVNFSVTRSLSGEEDEESKNSGIERRAASMNYKAKNYREDENKVDESPELEENQLNEENQENNLKKQDEHDKFERKPIDSEESGEDFGESHANFQASVLNRDFAMVDESGQRITQVFEEKIQGEMKNPQENKKAEEAILLENNQQEEGKFEETEGFKVNKDADLLQEEINLPEKQISEENKEKTLQTNEQEQENQSKVAEDISEKLENIEKKQENPLENNENIADKSENNENIADKNENNENIADKNELPEENNSKASASKPESMVEKQDISQDQNEIFQENKDFNMNEESNKNALQNPLQPMQESVEQKPQTLEIERNSNIAEDGVAKGELNESKACFGFPDLKEKPKEEFGEHYTKPIENKYPKNAKEKSRERSCLFCC